MSTFTASNLNLGNYFYTTKVRRSNSSILNSKCEKILNKEPVSLQFMDYPADISMNNDSNTIKYDFLSESDIDDSRYLNYDIDDEIITEPRFSLQALGDCNEEDISEALRNISSNQLTESFQRKPSKSKNKRKQGIVGRPTLSSAHDLEGPDHVYATGKYAKTFKYNDSYEVEKTYISYQQSKPIKSVGINKIFRSNTTGNKNRVYLNKNKEIFEYDDNYNNKMMNVSGNNRNRPRILTKPKLNEQREALVNQNSEYISEQDLFLNSSAVYKPDQRDADFARKIINRAQRVGGKVDPNKIPEKLLKEPNCNLDSLSESHEVNSFSQVINTPFVSDISISDSIPVSVRPTKLHCSRYNLTSNEIFLERPQSKNHSSMASAMSNNSSISNSNSMSNNSSNLTTTAVVTSTISTPTVLQNSSSTTNINQQPPPPTSQLTASTLLMRKRKIHQQLE